MPSIADRIEAIDREHPDAAEPILRLLADPYAHALLSALRHEHETLDDLVDVITAWRAVERTSVARPLDRRRTRLLLYHRYVPQLADLDLLDFDRAQHTVRGTAPEPVIDLLDAMPARNWDDD